MLEGLSRGIFGGYALDGHDVPNEWVEAISALDDHDRDHGLTSRMATDMLLSPPSVPELSGVNDFELTRLAAGADAS